MSNTKKVIFIKKHVIRKSTKKAIVEINESDVVKSAKKIEKSVMNSKRQTKPITFIEME